VREIPVAALDLNPGPTSLAARRAPAVSVQALLADQATEQPPSQDTRLDVIAGLPGTGVPGNGLPGNGNGSNGAAHPWMAVTSGGSLSCWPNGTRSL